MPAQTHRENARRRAGTGIAEGQSMLSRLAPSITRLIADRKGQILVEYLVLFVIVGAGLVMLVGPVVGPKLVNEYAKRRSLLYAPYP
jgi:hypothetical protein